MIYFCYNINAINRRLLMSYKKCPKCGLNYIKVDEELCSVCKPKESDFSHIVRGCVYGGNSRKIYEKFCETLGWDKNKSNQFGWQTPLYAANADTDRTNDVWFIFYPNYDVQKLDTVVDDYHVVNLIQNNGDKIIEIVDERIGSTNNANRITFVKTDSGYEFFGVYKIIKNGTSRIYRRISDHYPMK